MYLNTYTTHTMESTVQKKVILGINTKCTEIIPSKFKNTKHYKNSILKRSNSSDKKIDFRLLFLCSSHKVQLKSLHIVYKTVIIKL